VRKMILKEKFYNYFLNMGYNDSERLAILVTSLEDIYKASSVVMDKHVDSILATAPEDLDTLLGYVSDIHVEFLHIKRHIEESLPILQSLMDFLDKS
jgi:hypothetical protein